MSDLDRSMPNLRHLRAFRAVAGAGSLSAAAPRVYLSQPAISQAITKLESLVGSRLFERHSGGMVATPSGELLLDRAERALGYIRNGVREALRVGGAKAAERAANLDELLSTTQLRALVAVSAARSFSMAARTASVSQPSLHRAARELESVLDLTLFQRTPRGVNLTRAGTTLSRYTKLAFAEIEQGFTEVAEVQGLETGRILVGTMPLARTLILPTAINAIAAERPEVRVGVIDGPYTDLVRGLRHGELDLLIGALRIPPPFGDIVQEALFDDPLAVVARADHPLAGQAEVAPPELMAYPWVVPRRGTPTRAHFDRLLTHAGAGTPAGLVESSSLSLIRGLLLGSDRLTLISRRQIHYERKLGLLAPLPVDMARLGRPIGRPIGLTCRRDWRPTPTQRRFLETIRQISGSVAGE